MTATIKRHYFAVLIIGLHLLLGVFYSAIIPVWEAYDEWGHYPYVRYIATHHSLPDRSKQLTDYNDTVRSQPPLYYIIGAVATFWIDTSDWRDPIENRYSSLPTAMGGYNRALHYYDEDFPWRGWVLAVHVVRFVSVILSTITVGLTYLITRTIFPNRKEIAWGAMAINAFWPQFLFIGSVINNDNLVTTFGSLAMLFMARSVMCSPRWSVRIGLILAQAGAVTSKVVGFAFLPVTVWGMLWSFGHSLRQSKNRNSFKVAILLVVFSVVLLAIGIFVLFKLHPSYVREYYLFLRPPVSLSDMTLSYWLGIGGVIWGTLWASFGWQSVGIDNWVYQVVQPVWILALAGLGWFFLRSRERTVKWALFGLLLGVVILAAMTVYRGLFSAYYFTGRYLLSTISAFSVLLAVGLGSLGPRRWNRFILLAVGVAMALFAVYIPFAYIMPVYARPTKLAPESVEQLEHPLHVNFDHKIELIGYDMKPTTFFPGETIKLSLYWRCLEEMNRNYTLAIKLLGPNDTEYASLNVHPGRGNYPTSLWRKGDIFKDEYWMPVAADALPQTMVQAKVAFFLDRADLKHLPVYDEEGRSLDFAVFFGRFKVAPIRSVDYRPDIPVHYDLGENISLEGYNLPESVEIGSPLSLTLYWQARGGIDRPYTVFVHVIDEQGDVVAQVDGQPVGGHYPTDLWSAGESISDTHIVPLPEDLLPGKYRVSTGFYSLETGQRLTVLNEQGQAEPDNQIRLGEIGLNGDLR